MTAKLENLFVYGTLLESSVQKEVIGRIIEGRAMRIVGFGKTAIRVDGNVYPAIVPRKGSFVPGRVLTVTPEELAAIDAYETKAAYKRDRMVLADETAAFVYKPAKMPRTV